MANQCHKRDTNARSLPALSIRRISKFAAPVAALATVAVVSLGVANSAPEATDVVAKQNHPAATAIGAVAVRQERPAQVSRSGGRGRTDMSQVSASATYAARVEVAETKKAVASADTKQWTTADLNLWNSPTDKADKDGLIATDKQVLATGRERNGRAEIVVSKKSRWVTAEYLADKKPVEKVEAPTSSASASSSSSSKGSSAASGTGGTCSNGSSVPSGVSPNVVKVHQTVCARFPSISNYGTFRGDGEHAQGRAVDIMVSGGTGQSVAEYVRANAGSLGVQNVIYAQRIWSVDRGGEGWRGMSDRGSSTANHFDHVHVTVY